MVWAGVATGKAHLLPATTALAATAIAGVFVVIAAFEAGVNAPVNFILFICHHWRCSSAGVCFPANEPADCCNAAGKCAACGSGLCSIWRRNAGAVRASCGDDADGDRAQPADSELAQCWRSLAQCPRYCAKTLWRTVCIASSQRQVLAQRH